MTDELKMKLQKMQEYLGQVRNLLAKLEYMNIKLCHSSSFLRLQNCLKSQ